MAKTPSLRLVIDTSVTSAASDREDPPDPTPRRCREFLEAVLEICHRIVLTPRIAEEWKSHRSRYASRWRTSMYARKKIFALKVEPEDSELARAVLSTAESRKARTALEKDLPFILSALETDLAMVSRDDEARRLYRRAATLVPRLRPIIWTNPVTDQELRAWLRGEAEAPSGLKLGESSPD